MYFLVFNKFCKRYVLYLCTLGERTAPLCLPRARPLPLTIRLETPSSWEPLGIALLPEENFPLLIPSRSSVNLGHIGRVLFSGQDKGGRGGWLSLAKDLLP